MRTHKPLNTTGAKTLLFKEQYGDTHIRLFKNVSALVEELMKNPLSKLQHKTKSALQAEVYGLLAGERLISDDFMASIKALVKERLSTASDVDSGAIFGNIIDALQGARSQDDTPSKKNIPVSLPIAAPALRWYKEAMRFADNAYVIAKRPLEFSDSPNSTVQEMIDMHTRILSRYGDEKSTKAEGAPELFYFLPEKGDGTTLWKRLFWRLKEYASKDPEALQRMALYSGNKDSATKREGDIVIEHLQKCNEEGYIRVFDDLSAGGYFIADHVVCNPGDGLRMKAFYYRGLGEHKLSELDWDDREYWNDVVLKHILKDTVSGKNEVSCKDVFDPRPQ